MSKINITKDDVGRKFVTINRKVVTIKAIDPNDASYPIETNNGSYTRNLKYFHCQYSSDDFSHWADEPAPAEEPEPSLTPWMMTCHSKEPAKPARTPEWWATFSAVLPAVVLRHATSTDYESMVATATEITNEAHK